MPEQHPMTLSDEELGAFREQNPEFDLLSFDFHDHAATRNLRWEGDGREELLNQVKAVQRVARLTGSPETSVRLLAAGLDSAQRIGAMSQLRFVREHGRLFSDDDAARKAHRKATAIRSATQHLWANVRDLVASRHYRGTRFYNAQDDLTEYFQQIPSYQDLFGSLDHLACPHCRSVLSPGAYFVDLMRVADEYVTYPNTHKGSDNIPDGMTLEQRRPDLFTLPLTCESTDTSLPYLQIVNEVLEQKLKAELRTGLRPESVSGSEPEVEVFAELAVAPYPFDLPFNLPLRQIRGELAALKTTLAEVYATVSGPFASGQARSGTAGTIVLATTASQQNGHYEGMKVTLTEGAGAGQTRRIVGYDGSTRTAKVSPDWQAPPADQTRYEIEDTVDPARERLGLSPEQYRLVTTPAATEAEVALRWGYRDQELFRALPPFTPGSGHITVRKSSTSVSGDKDTHFDTWLAVGDQLWCGPQIRTVAAVSGPSSLTVDRPWDTDEQDADYKVVCWVRGPGAITVHRGGTRVTGDDETRFDRLSAGDQLQCAGSIRTIAEIRGARELLVDSPWPADALQAPYTVNLEERLDRVTTFLDRTGSTAAELEDLFRQGTSPREFDEGVTGRFFINATGEGLPPLQIVNDQGDPANPFQRVIGLSVERLDRLDRFIRLRRALGWTAADTGWLMSSTGAVELDAPLVEAMADARRLVADGPLPADLMTGFWHDLKTTGRVDESRPQDPFDRVFNPPALLRGQDPYTSPEPIPFDPGRPLVWDVDERTAGSGGAAIRGRLLGALGTTDEDLTRVAHFVRALQGRPGTSLRLDLPTMSWLFRLVKQASWNRLTVDEYFTLLWLSFYPEQPRPLPPPKDAVPLGIAATERVRTFSAWLHASPFDVYQLRYVLTGEESTSFKPDVTPADLRVLINDLAVNSQAARLTPGSLVSGGIGAERAQRMFDRLVADGLITALGIATDKPPVHSALAALVPLAEDSFITRDIDRAQSARIFTELAEHDPPYVIVVEGRSTGTLSAAFTPQTPLGFLLPEDPHRVEKQNEVREVLLRVRTEIGFISDTLGEAAAAQEAQAEQGVAERLRTDHETLLALLSFCTGQDDLAAQRVALLTPLPEKDPVPPAATALMTALMRGSVWARPLGLTAAELTAVAADPRPFGIRDTRALRPVDVRTLECFRHLTAAFDDQDGVLFEYFTKPQAREAVALLSELTGWSPDQLDLLIEVFWPKAGGREPMSRTVDGVARLKAAFDLCRSTGTDAFFLVDLLELLHLPVGVPGGSPDPTAWAAYKARAGRTLDALSGRYGEGFPEVYAQVSGEIDTAKRDALLGRTIWLLQRRFPFLRTPTDLYQFLLIDLEMSDCATTTRVAQGIGSVQLYLQRCRMSLEPGVTELDVDPAWWQWLAAYRTWEANRKIFLYPESYLQPQLRSGLSPEFERLAESLLQSDLDQNSVRDAYLRYFDELDGLADLVPVAGHNADVTKKAPSHPALDGRADGDRDTRLFVVARPRTDPYAYFWRSRDPITSWSPWQKIDLSITSPEIAAVYAFERLFLFWAELDTGQTSTIDEARAQARYTRNAVLRYSFRTVAGQWIQPQLLARGIPTEVEPNPYTLLDKAPVKTALTPSGLYWRQPYPLVLARGMTGTGRVLITRDLHSVQGAGTLFLRQIRVGDRICVGGQNRVVGVVIDDTALTVTSPWTRSARDAEFKVVPERPDQNAFPPFDGSGRVRIVEGLAMVTGNDATRFTKEVSVGDRILCANQVRGVLDVTSDDHLIVDAAWKTTCRDEKYVVVPNSTGTERLAVLFGGALPTATDIDPVPPEVKPNAGRDPFLQQLEDFNFGLFYSAVLARNMRESSPGQVSLNYSAVLDQDLQVQDTRMLVTDYGYSASDNPRPYGYRLDRSERILQVAQIDNMIADNYWGNNVPGTPPPPGPTGLSRTLLYNVSPTASMRNIGNQPGWATFDNGDEVFLVRSTEPELGRLSALAIDSRISDEERGEALMLSTGALTGGSEPFEKVSFAFTRLTTAVIPALRRRLLAGGVDRLLSLESQLLPEPSFSRFYATAAGGPPPGVIPPAQDRLDFDGAYGLYFQEMFLFCPWLVADRLQSEQRFEDAKKWYEYLFDPTERPSIEDRHANDRYWRYLPFRDLTLSSLTTDLTDPRQISAYNDDPFDPDAIARLRPAAYPKAVVMDYIDNLLHWGDHLFARDTSESVNEATQLYVLAADLLGPRPRETGTCAVPQAQDFARIRAGYGQDIPQFLIDLENGLPQVMNAPTAFRDVPINEVKPYFCVPDDSRLTTYWDRVEDRLFKIRHCMNLQGVVRGLADFEPPLEPGGLVRARARTGGGAPAAVPTPGPLPAYRFTTMLEKARSFAGNVIALGSELLSALEKQDAEQLALLRDKQEAALLDLTVQTKQLQIQQAVDTGRALLASRDSAKARQAHYRRLIEEKLSPEELANLRAMAEGLVFNILAGTARTASSIAYTIPQIGSPFAITYGGVQVGSALAAGSAVLELGSAVSQFKAQQSLTMGGYQRRNQEWELQLSLADHDQTSASAQLAANEAQRQTAERDLQLTLTSIAQNRELHSFLATKFTNRQLYQWMAGRLSEVYFQTWLLALALARGAERALQYEIDTSRTFLDFVSWDGARRGLLAGEGLALALARMEKAYLDGHSRTLEIEKTVSLAQVDPRALLDLRATGECTFHLSERLFDFDFPGQYCRKLKTVSVTIPAVVGPYQTVHATLAQLSNATVLKPDPAAIRYLLGSDPAVPSSDVLRSDLWINQQIALSRGVNDAGLFQLDFGDPRFLPFEGTGAVSTWRLSMPPQTNRFDFSSISDVLVHLSYTAKDGGATLREQVVAQPELRDYAGSPLLSLSQMYSQEWYAFMTDHSDPASQSLRFSVPPNLVPPHLERPRLVGFLLQLITAEPDGGPAAAPAPYLEFKVTDDVRVAFAPGPNGAYSHAFAEPVDMERVFAGGQALKFTLAETPAHLKIDGFLDPAVLGNVALVLFYEATVNWSRTG